MTAIINNVIVQGKPEEIKELLDAYNPPGVFTTVEFNKPATQSETWEPTEKEKELPELIKDYITGSEP